MCTRKRKCAERAAPVAVEPEIPVSTLAAYENIAKLAATQVLRDFVRENNGIWNHEKWLCLCGKITEMGYSPIDFDQVGVLLEREKAEYLAGLSGT